MVNSTSSASSSSSSSSSLLSLDDTSVRCAASAMKFLCSYGGRILPRYLDGRLRYAGGETRVLAVDRSVTLSELLVKMGDLCGWEVEATQLRCQLPMKDLDDALISVTSDEDLFNLIEEYDVANRDRPSPLKIRAFLLSKFPSPPASAGSSPPPTKGKSPLAPPPSSSHRLFSPPSSLRFSACHNPQRHRQQQYLSGYGGGMMMSSHRNNALGCGAGNLHLVHSGHHLN